MGRMLWLLTPLWFCLADILSRVHQSSAFHVFLCAGDPGPVPHYQVQHKDGCDWDRAT